MPNANPFLIQGVLFYLPNSLKILNDLGTKLTFKPYIKTLAFAFRAGEQIFHSTFPYSLVILAEIMMQMPKCQLTLIGTASIHNPASLPPPLSWDEFR